MSSAYYRRLKSDRERELRDYKKRKSQLESIKKDYTSAFENNASDINRQSRNVSEGIKSAIHTSGGSVSAADVWKNAESGLGDSDLSSSYTYTCAEYNRVVNRISDLEREIARLQNIIRQEEEKERKEREEALKKLLGVD